MKEKILCLKTIIIVLITILFIWNVFLQCKLNSIDKKFTKKLERIESDAEDRHIENHMRMDDIESDMEDKHFENQMRMDDIESDAESRAFENEMRIDENETRINNIETELEE